MDRVFDEKAFFEAIEDWRAVPFDRAESNCCHFAADVVARSTGFKYDIPHTENPEDVKAYLESKGSKSLYAYLRRLLGKPIAPIQAPIGSVAYRSSEAEGYVPGEATVGIVDRGKAWFLGPTGLHSVRLGRCTKAFRTY